MNLRLCLGLQFLTPSACLALQSGGSALGSGAALPEQEGERSPPLPRAVYESGGRSPSQGGGGSSGGSACGYWQVQREVGGCRVRGIWEQSRVVRDCRERETPPPPGYRTANPREQKPKPESHQCLVPRYFGGKKSDWGGRVLLSTSSS